MKQKILIVGGDGALLERIEPMLARASVETLPVPGAKHAVALLRQMTHIEFVIVCYPLPDATMAEFFQSLEETSGAEPFTYVLIVTPEPHVAELADFAADSLDIVSLDQPEEELAARLARFLRQTPRPALRIMVKLNIELGAGRVHRLCKTQNISASGMLVKTDDHFPLGSMISLEFQLPDGSEPIRGEAQVVRHTRPEREDIVGMGLRFLELYDDGQELLEAFVAERIQEAGPSRT